jgi:uncharacterized membrane-anchored protein
MRPRPKVAQQQNARLLAGVLLCGLLASVLAADEMPQSVRYVECPASVTLGAEAVLELPAGWCFVPREELAAYFGDGPHRVGAWDRGLVLAGDPAFELRLLFEPLGAVALEPLPDPEALLPRAQSLAREVQRRPGRSSTVGRELAAWRWEPFFQPELQSLRFGGAWRQDGDELLSLHVRWLGRRGVLKLDWLGPEDEAEAFSAYAERLEEGLRFSVGHGRSDAGPADPIASLDLSGLVLDGLLGRAATQPGGKAAEPWPWWAWLAVAIAGSIAVAVGTLTAWRRLNAWLDRRQKRQDDARRLEHLERSFGGRADEVEVLDEETQP